GARSSVAVPCVADVDVEPSIAVHIGEGHPGGPSLALQAGRFGDIAKPELPLVQVQSGAALIRRQHDLRQAVTREVADRRPAPVIIVAIGEDVQLAAVGETILEPYAR